MKGKTSLALMEQTLMLLVFALAAALCLKGFLWAGQISRENAVRDRAVICAQNLAERIKANGLDEPLTLYYDENWQPASENGAYVVTALPESAPAGLGRAVVTVSHRAGTPVFSIPAAWQEVQTP